jgi:hypothetical protein
MNLSARETLWQELLSGGLVEGALPEIDRVDSPWYVRVMLGISGWIGSLFLFGFVGVGFSFVMKSALAALLVGGLVCAAAFALFRVRRDSDFVTQFALAVSLAGQLLIVYGIFELMGKDEAVCYGAVCLVEVLLTLFMPNFISRVMTSMAAGIALAFTLNSFGLYGIATALTAAGFALIWMQEVRWVKFRQLCCPVGYGLTLSLLLYRTSFLWGRSLWWSRSHRNGDWLSLYSPWLGKALVLTVFLAVVFVLLKRLNILPMSRSGLIMLVGAAAVLAITLQAPGIASALLIMMVGFAVCNRILIGLGVLAFGSFLSNYYYLMNSTLMEKSMLLIGSGVLLLLGRLAVRSWLSSPGGQADA